MGQEYSRYTKPTIVTYQYRRLWMKRYATIVIQTWVSFPGQRYVSASDEEIKAGIKSITRHRVTKIIEACML